MNLSPSQKTFLPLLAILPSLTGLHAKSIKVVMMLLAVVGWTGAANATLVEVSVTGEVSTIENNPFGLGLTGGELLSGTFQYDTTATPDFSTSNLAIYLQTGFAFSLGATSFTSDSFYIGIGNNLESGGDPNTDIFSFVVYTGTSTPVPTAPLKVNGTAYPDALFSAQFNDTDATVFNGLSLPNPLPSSSAFEKIQEFQIIENTSTSGSIARFYVDNVSFTSTVVPVPAAVWLFGTALIGLFGFSKRRKAS